MNQQRKPQQHDITGYMLIATPTGYRVHQRLSSGHPGALMGGSGNRAVAERVLAAFNASFARRATSQGVTP